MPSLGMGLSIPMRRPVVPAFVMPGSSLDMNFAAGQYYGASLSDLTTVRASVGYAQTSAGLLTSFLSNIPRITDLGFLIEEARTNVVLWCRDLTNAAWTKSNVTATLNQTGADGSSNSATSLTATAGNGTVLQAITLGSSARFQSVWIKRLVGAGNIQMTMDNGSTWTTITVTASYTQLSIPTQTLANPTVGFRIVTSGDSVAVDFVQNENGAFVTSPILTTTASASRAADVITLTGATAAAAALSAKAAYAQTNLITGSTVSNRILTWAGGATLALLPPNVARVQNSGAPQVDATFGSGSTAGVAKAAFGFDSTGMTSKANAGTTATNATAMVDNTGAATLGNMAAGTRALNGYLARFALSTTKGQFDGMTA